MEIPIIKIHNMAFLPYEKFYLRLTEEISKVAYVGNFIGVVYSKSQSEIKEIGIVCKVLSIHQSLFYTLGRNNTSDSKVLLQGVSRMKILNFDKPGDKSIYLGKVEILEDEIVSQKVKEEISKENLFEKMKLLMSKYTNKSYDFETNYVKVTYEAVQLINNLKVDQKQSILECNNQSERMRLVLNYLQNFTNHNNYSNPSSNQISPSYPNHFIDTKNPLNVIEDKISKSQKMTEEAKAIARKDIERLKSLHKSSPEYDSLLSYVETLVNLPWDNSNPEVIDIKKAQEILDRDHYGLEKVKKRIIEYISVRKLAKNNKGSILCLSGPPGVGKTSLGRSIAEALNKKFYRISLGGVRDEAQIRGHRKTYIGSMPGLIIQAIKRVNCRNPLFLLDEIDKVSNDNFKGDPSSALLEVLDPEQNNTFIDNYINTPFDLSEVFFICTANFLNNIQPPLLDRLEVINIPGYTLEEKTNIAKKYLFNKQIKLNGIPEGYIIIKDQIISKIVSDYTYESGVRQLERNFGKICRYAARLIVEEQDKQNGAIKGNLELSNDNLKEILGKPFPSLDVKTRIIKPGVSIGLSYTQNGGALTLIESSMFEGSGQLLLTGNMGDIMRESVSTGLSWIKSNALQLKLSHIDFKKTDIHIHVPNAAVPKDGPSAGITIIVSLISLFKNISIRDDTAMTGEISLQGQVLPIGGLKEKSLAAMKHGLKRVIIPEHNKDDLKEFPEYLMKNIKFIIVKDITDVIRNAFHSLSFDDKNNLIHEVTPKF